jgi:hypothetical protein
VAGILNTRDFNLSQLALITPVGTIDLRYIMTELSYHEDLFSNFISGYVMVTEANAYSELLSLTGNEFLFIEFSKSTDSNVKISKYFRAYKMGNRKLSANMVTESYCLYFCSEELLLSDQYKISKAYSNQTIDAIITDICKMSPGLNIGPKKFDPKNIEKSYGTYSFVVPNLKPFDAINWLSVYARPQPDAGTGADMLFFENRDGFNFKSLQTLTGPNAVVHNRYRYDPKNVYAPGAPDFDLTEEVYNVTTYEILDSYDALEATNSGMFANQLMSVDILTRKRTTTDFNYMEYWSDPKTHGLNNNPVTNNYKNRNGDGVTDTSQAMLKLVFSNFDSANADVVKNNPGAIAGNIFAETYIPYRTAQLALANYTRMKISVPGDPVLTVGEIIDFELLSRNPANKTSDLFYSGYYLVTAVRHMITENDYKTVLEIAKESSRTKYADPPSGSSTWATAAKN